MLAGRIFNVKTFGNILKDLRLSKGMSQRRLAVALDVQPAAISSWERGITFPSILYACDIADYFGCTLDYLVGRTNGN